MPPSAKGLRAVGDAGKPVDWWFMYKLPHIAAESAKKYGGQPSVGNEYLYFDSTSRQPPQLSAYQLGAAAGALHQTLSQLYPLDSKRADGIGWVMYNDEHPADMTPRKADNTEMGHCKGVLAYDTKTDSAFWLLHSTPKFSMLKEALFPDSLSGLTKEEDEVKYGQTFLCVTLKGWKTASQIADQMYHQHEPQIYSVHTPPSLPAADPLAQLAKGVSVSETDPPGKLWFQSKGGQKFLLVCKNRHWNDDFWPDLVGPTLGVDLDVETWRRDPKDTDQTDSDKKDKVDIVRGIDLRGLDAKNLPYVWPNSNDHAKWALSVEQDWVCVGDINLDKSQRKRGGGAICFQNKLLWQSLSKVQKLVL